MVNPIIGLIKKTTTTTKLHYNIVYKGARQTCQNVHWNTFGQDNKLLTL